jgi:hypothetical protein
MRGRSHKHSRTADAAGVRTNAALLLIVGAAIMGVLRRFAHRLEPAVLFEPEPSPKILA